MTDAQPQTPTALNLLRGEIQRFLGSAAPEVLCIRGKWGVGKTYTWETILRETHAADGVKLNTYSYVSLFGLEGLDRLKSSVFENAIAVEFVGTEPTIESLGASLKSLGKIAATAWKPGLGVLADHAAFLSVSKYIICIDDLERKGEKLRIIDILGLASLLKERRKCKIVLILNDAELGKDDETAFALYSEKVIDTSLVFEPTPIESAEIALKGPSAHERLLTDYCIKLGIANIRILKKIERLVHNVEPSLRAFDARVLEQAVATLTLFGWCVYGKQSALLDFAMNKRYRSRYGLSQGKLSEEDLVFNNQLDAYPFGAADAFDRVLFDGINTGFFDTPKLLKEAAALDQKYKNEAIQAILNKPWDDYRNSFDDNADIVSSALSEALLNHMPHVNMSYLDQSVTFLKRLGKPDLAASAITRWMEVNDGLPNSSFDFSNMSFPPSDPDLIKALKDKFTTFTDDRDPAVVLFDMAKNNGWGEDDITLLSKLSEDQFYAMFKSLRELELRSVVRKALELGKQGSAGDARYLAIEKNARGAVERIGKESAINAERIRGLYNV